MRLGNPLLDIGIPENRIFGLEFAVSNLYDAFKILEEVPPSQESNVLRQGQPQSPLQAVGPQSLRRYSLPQLQLVLQPVERLCVLCRASAFLLRNNKGLLVYCVRMS